jgi:hypothetical protein
MQLAAIREVREAQCTTDVNAYLEANWLLIGCQERQATDAQGADGYFVFILGSTDHSWDPYAEEAAEEKYKRALAVTESFEANHSEKAEKLKTSERARRLSTLRQILSDAPELSKPSGQDRLPTAQH